MALLYQAELTPSKLELVQAWAPGQDWFTGDDGGALVSVGSFRFDDPAGEVGIETLLVQTPDGPTMQIPLTYRGAPLAGAEAFLIGTMQHSVLGDRWVYDAVGDPAYIDAATRAIRLAEHEAPQFIDIDGERITREPTAEVRGSGITSDAPATAITRLTVLRVPGAPSSQADSALVALGTLTGTWAAQPEPQTLATLGYTV
jgi:hypothetical protein